MKTYFTIEELTRSAIARARGIDNTPTPQAREALQALIDRCLQPIRAEWSRPILVNSGYRSPALNAAVGGAANSQHVKGEAADITVGSREDNRALFELIRENGFEFDQLIDELDYRWLHISYTTARSNRREVKHLK